jgi:hypothetical protein
MQHVAAPDLVCTQFNTGILYLQVMVLEPDAQQRPLQWPVVYRGNGSQDWDAQGVSVWSFPDKPNKGVRVLSADYSQQTVQSLGTPGEV